MAESLPVNVLIIPLQIISTTSLSRVGPREEHQPVEEEALVSAFSGYGRPAVWPVGILSHSDRTAGNLWDPPGINTHTNMHIKCLKSNHLNSTWGVWCFYSAVFYFSVLFWSRLTGWKLCLWAVLCWWTTNSISMHLELSCRYECVRVGRFILMKKRKSVQSGIDDWYPVVIFSKALT